MFYQLEDDTLSISASELNDKILTVGFISLSELEELYKPLGFYAKSVEKCKISSSTISDIDMLEGYCFFILALQNDSRLAVFVKKNLLLLVNLSDIENSNKNYFLSLVSSCKGENLSLERAVCNLLELITADLSRQLEDKRQEISCLEESVLSSTTDKDFNQHLLAIRRELLALVGFFERLIGISETLSDNENQLFDDTLTPLFDIFTKKAERSKDTLNLLCDSVVHLWDSFQAHLDTKLNETMKIFTMMTTIFFPLTVIVGWYGMNFSNMPELSADWGYPFVIALSIALITALIVWFKIKKWI